MTSPIESAAPTQITIHPAPEVSRTGGFFAGPAASVHDLIDVVNPLQHIPFANALYQEMSGDTIGAGARLAGGTLFGGVFGFFAGLASVIFENATGHSTGGAVLSALRGESVDPNLQYAQGGTRLGDFAGDVKLAFRRDCSFCDGEVMIARATPQPQEQPVEVASIAPMPQPDITTSLPVPPVPQPSASKEQRDKDRDVLTLFGHGAAEAGAAYEKAGMRDYLKEASTNLIM